MGNMLQANPGEEMMLTMIKKIPESRLPVTDNNNEPFL
jgi:hypothetical protein